jgi:hypothetical protein
LRAALLGSRFDLWGLGISALWTAILLCVAVVTFRKMESYFADII